MTNPSIQSITKSTAWQALVDHARQSNSLDLNTLFRSDPERASRFSLTTDNLLADFSKQKISDETLSLLYTLAEQRHVKTAINDLLTGKKVNYSENRPALHTALRSVAQLLMIDDNNIMDEIRKEQTRMSQFVDAIHNGKFTGSTGKKFRTIINIGIGGSDLGPRLAVQALQSFCNKDIEVRFVANIDYQDLHSCLKDAEPETTLFIIASKSFTTLETLGNAKSARQWLLDKSCNNIANHFIAVTANQPAAIEFGINLEHILEFWDWVGGRYSLWSAIGLPIAIATGMDSFTELLSGARSMDEHFASAPLEENLPVTLALIDIWNNNFLAASTLAVIPYDHSMALLPDYLSQLMMESNGKNITQAGLQVDYNTGLIIWGAAGTNSQHAFFQLLHQGTQKISVEFLVAVNSNTNHPEHQLKLVANCFAQSEALMAGRKNPADEPHRDFPGNHQSTTLVYDRLTPFVLGQLLALYEHRTFVQACIWDINAFDQWGVELGKKLAGVIIDEFESGSASKNHDASTCQLIEIYLDKRN